MPTCRKLRSLLRGPVPGWGAHLSTTAPVAQQPPQQGPAKIIFAPSGLDHDQLRDCTLTRREFIRGDGPGQSAQAAAKAIFRPSPASQMCQGMAFGYSLFYRDKYLRPDLLAKALGMLAAELPPLTGRVQPPTRPPGLRRLGDVIVDLNGAGIEFALAEARAHTIQGLGPHTWTLGMRGKPLSGFGVPFYAEPFSVPDMYAGKEALFKVRLTRCADGHVLSVTVSHLLADAGRAVQLVERVAELYRAAAGGSDPGAPLRFDPGLETPRGLAAAVRGAPEEWTPPPPDHGLSAGQLLAAPYRMYRHATTKYDVHMIYLPEESTKRLKAIAAGAGGGAAVPTSGRVSTMDAVQAFTATLVADLRRRALVPTAPEEMTVNVDLLHQGGGQGWKYTEAAARHVGNAVHILHVPGVDPGTGESFPQSFYLLICLGIDLFW